MSSSDAENDDLFGANSPQAQPASAPSPAGSSHSVEDKPEEPADAAEEPAEGNDLFGDDDDDDRPRRSPSTTPAGSSPRRSRSGTPNPLEYPESETEMQEMRETWGTLPLPQWPHLQPTDGKVWHLKLPAYVDLEPRPYDADHYRETQEDDGRSLDNMAAKGKMIRVRNTMRWRWVTGPDGKPVKQSNARMLRWSDGSVSLQLGNEMFDLASSYGSTLARPEDPAPKKKEGESSASQTTFLCLAAPSEQVLVTETAIAGQLNLVPTSMDSKTHMELVNHVGQQHVKHSKMKLLNDLEDQDLVNELLLKAAHQRQVLPTKRPTRPRGEASTSSAGRRMRGGPAKRADYSDDSDGGYGFDTDRRGTRSSMGTRGGRDTGEYDEDDGFVVADSDEDGSDGAYGSKKKKSKKSRKRVDYDSLDETELADQRIEEAERERKRQKKDKGGKSKGKSRSKEYATSEEEEEEEDAEGEPEEDDADMDMDVESEEE